MSTHPRKAAAAALLIAGIAGIGTAQAQTMISVDGSMTRAGYAEGVRPQAHTPGLGRASHGYVWGRART
jgi:hypothetical protein